MKENQFNHVYTNGMYIQSYCFKVVLGSKAFISTPTKISTVLACGMERVVE